MEEKAETAETALIPSEITAAQIIERVAITGDLSKLRPEERVAYYMRVCESLGLNPLTKPFDYITLNSKLTLYPARGATDQIRKINGISVLRVEYPTPPDGLLVAVAYGRARDGREDSGTGVVNVKGLPLDALANAMMRAETKAKRRMTLSLVGLSFPDETEVPSIPDAEPTVVDEHGNIQTPRLADKIAARVAAISEPEPNVPDVPTVVPDRVPDPYDTVIADALVEIVEGIAELVEEIESEPVNDGSLTLEEFSALVAGMERQLVRRAAQDMYPKTARFTDMTPTQLGTLYAYIVNQSPTKIVDNTVEEVLSSPMTEQESSEQPAPGTLCGEKSPFSDLTCDLELGHHTYHRGAANERW